MAQAAGLPILSGGTGLTRYLEELADEFGMSRERVRQIEMRAFGKVQKTVRNRLVAMERADVLAGSNTMKQVSVASICIFNKRAPERMARAPASPVPHKSGAFVHPMPSAKGKCYVAGA